MTTLSLALGLAIAAAAAGAGVGSWRAAVVLARIESQRRRAELTPVFEIKAVSRGGHADLYVILRGPDTLDALDEVVIRILDERWHDHGGRPTPGGPSADEIAKQVFGPYEFNIGASAQVGDNRTSLPRRYSRETGKDWDRFSLIPSAPPRWASGINPEQWMRRHSDQPIRLLVSCRLDEHRWELPYDVRLAPASASQGPPP